MKTADVAEHYGSEYKAAKALGCHQSNLTRWKTKVPELWACKLHLLTNGALRWEPADYPARNRK
jgi:hypothetical protein